MSFSRHLSENREKSVCTLFFILSQLYIGLTVSYAQSPELRSQDSFKVRNGMTQEASIVADVDGEVFIEVPKNILVNVFRTHYEPYRFSGFVHAPKLTVLTTKFPYQRYRDITVFEFMADSGMDVRFSDRYVGLKNKQIRQLETQNTEYLRQKLKVFMPLDKSKQIQKPALWFFQSEKGTWIRLGGIYKETKDPEKKLFTATIMRTGLYALMDENPLPQSNMDTYTNPDKILRAEDSPYPSVIASEVDVRLYEGLFDGVGEVPSLDGGGTGNGLDISISSGGGQILLRICTRLLKFLRVRHLIKKF